MRAIAVSFIFLLVVSTALASPRQCKGRLKAVNSGLRGKLNFDIENLWSTFENENENAIEEVKTANVPNGLTRKNPEDGSRLPLETLVMVITLKNGKKIYLREIKEQIDWKGQYTTNPSWNGHYVMAQVDKTFSTRLNSKEYDFTSEGGSHSTTIIRGGIGANKFLGIGGH